jgi:uncharacterized protein (DUF1015 family)
MRPSPAEGRPNRRPFGCAPYAAHARLAVRRPRASPVQSTLSYPSHLPADITLRPTGAAHLAMARIYPFPATRYNPSLVRIDDVVTQPYDKITPSMQQAYYRRSPYNLVRIILGLPELFDEPGVNDIYTRAARDFADWRSRGILYTEPEPCIFAYSQRFGLPGRPGEFRERRGFIALSELADYSQRIVFRHEQTLSKPKSDRLNLLQATRAHFGQIFMLYSDPALTIERMLFGPTFRPEIEITDEYGVVHRVAKVSDPHTIRLVAGAMEDRKLIIADGHHRYETALNYSREHAPAQAHRTERDLATTLPRPVYPEAAVMATFVNMDSAGLTILPTHRVVFGLPSFLPSDFLARAEAFFHIRPLPPADTVALTRQLDEAGLGGTAFVALTPGAAHLLVAKPEPVAQALGNTPEHQRQLDVVQLHALVLEQLLGISPEAIREQRNLRYLRDAAEAADQVSSGEAQSAFLLNPVTLDQLREVAFNGQVMPQKSTDFYPKLLSGLAIYALP